MTDVWISAGVLIGIGAVALSGWERLDPIIALLVAANIIWLGEQLVRRSALGLLDTALPEAELAAIRQMLDR
jgi:divalent metal cation (Fe/Co/Zn/Cd) transporter